MPGYSWAPANDPGPSLVIQDELHLISGPLGTIVGLYEAAFDVVMRATVPGRRSSLRPPRSAVRISRSTAFSAQCGHVPAIGLDADDSYFVRFDRDIPDACTAGSCHKGTRPLTAMVHLSLRLLQAPLDLSLRPPAEDAYWTLVAYHNSLRELGKSVTLAHDDIPARISVIAETRTTFGAS